MEKQFANRFQVVSKIFSDATDALYNILDEKEDLRPKTLHVITSVTPPPDTLEAFSLPIQHLKALQHPNLLQIKEWGISDEGSPFYVMEAASGKMMPFEKPPLPSKTVLKFLFQLCHAVFYLHENGWVHGNLKPSSLLRIDDRIKIFGYTTLFWVEGHHPLSHHLSKAYTAPEVLEGAMPNPRSDLFSIGAIGYYLFTGHSPDLNKNDERLIQTLETQYEIPLEVSGIIQRLCSNDPKDRYQSANEAFLALRDVTGKAFVPDHFDDFSFAYAKEALNPISSREKEIQILKEKIGEKTSPVIIISGESGSGKTHLLQRLKRHVSSKYDLLFQGFCIESEGIAYRPIREILRQLIPILIKENDNRLPFGDHQCAVLATLIPELWELPFMQKIAPPEALEHDTARQRMNHTIAQMLLSAARVRPTLIYIHHLQWADEASLALFSLLMSLPIKENLTLYASYDTNEKECIKNYLSLNVPPETFHLNLQPLTQKHSGMLIRKLLFTDKVPSSFLDAIFTATQGNIFFAKMMVQHLTQRQDLLKPTITGWTFETKTLKTPSLTPKNQLVPHDLKTLIKNKKYISNHMGFEAKPALLIKALIKDLPQDTRKIMFLSSIMGSVFWVKALEDISPYSKNEVFLALNELIRKGLIAPYPVRSHKKSRLFLFSHPMVQRIAYQTISEEEKSLYHLKFAGWLKRRGVKRNDEQIGMIADHLESAGEKNEAMTCLMQAGGQAAAQFAHTQAINYLNRAFKLTSENALVERFALLRVREEVNNSRGDRKAQLKDLNSLEAIVDILKDDQRRIDLVSLKINYKTMCGDFIGAIEDAKHMIRLSEKLKDVKGIAEGYYEWGSIQWRQGELLAAGQKLERSLAIAKSAGLYNTQLSAVRTLGNVNRSLGHFAEAMSCYDKALALAETHHAITEKSAIIINIGLIYISLGDYGKADEYYKEALLLSQKTGDIRVEVASYANWAELKTLAHAYDEALSYAEKAYHLSLNMQHPRYQAYTAMYKGDALHGLKRFDEAINAFQISLSLHKKQGQNFEIMKIMTTMADIALKKGERDKAKSYIEEILSFEAENSLIGASEPFRVYLMLYQVLIDIKDERANEILIISHRLLLKQAKEIKDKRHRDSFLKKVSAHRALQKAYSKNPQLNQLEKRIQKGTKKVKQPPTDESKAEAETRSFYKNTEAALWENEVWFRSIAENASEAIIIFDDKENILFWNKSAHKMFGYTITNSRHQLFISLLARSFRETFQKEASVRNETSGSMEKPVIFTGTRRDGTEFPLEMSLTTFKRKKRLLYTVIGRDITERKRVEKILEQSKQKAESAHEEMSEINQRLEMAMEKVKEMAIKAKAANRAKSEFLANMSHEIRTPMNAIIGLSHLTLDTNLNDEQKEYLSAIGASAEKLLSIINDILDFSKIEAGHLDLEEIDFNLLSTMNEITDTLSVKVHEKGLELLSHIECDVPLNLVGDPIRIHQILLNLGGNAVKFTEKGEIFISCSVNKMDQKSATLQFSVRDTGIGIEDTKKESIFESFKQADGSTTRQFGGTGLGLSISKQLIEKMGGEVWIESKPGKGSIFHFTIQTGVNPASSKTFLMNDVTELKGKRVLIVDDNKSARILIKEMLSQWEMKCDEAEGGKNALNKLEASVRHDTPYDVILIDAVMPKPNGFETIEKIRSDHRYQAYPIILMILMGMDRMNEKLKGLNISSHILKPVKEVDILSRMKALFSQTDECVGTAPCTPESPPIETPQRSLKILLAEDNQINQMMAVRLLEKIGHKVSVAGNGNVAVAKVQSETFDIVLMDVQMPEMDGFEATRKIRALDSDKKDIPIIAMTAFAMKGDQEKCLAAGMNDYIPKPIEPGFVKDILLKWSRS